MALDLEIDTSEISSEEMKLSFLLSDDTTTASIILVEKACEQYQNLYKRNNVPYSYIEFFSTEFNKYSGLFTNKLKTFYDNFELHNIKPEDLVDRYVKSLYAQHDGVKADKDEMYLCFKQPIALSFTNEMQQVSNKQASDMVENIINICHKIDTQDELVDIVELYEYFMMDKVIEQYDFGKRKIKNKQTKHIEEKPTTPETKILVGTAIEDNYESRGRVTKIIIPKLNLPSAYPIESENSRITAGKKVEKFCPPANQVEFINKKRIVSIKYSSNFLAKRAPVKKKKTFDWDF